MRIGEMIPLELAFTSPSCSCGTLSAAKIGLFSPIKRLGMIVVGR